MCCLNILRSRAAFVFSCLYGCRGPFDLFLPAAYRFWFVSHSWHGFWKLTLQSVSTVPAWLSVTVRMLPSIHRSLFTDLLLRLKSILSPGVLTLPCWWSPIMARKWTRVFCISAPGIFITVNCRDSRIGLPKPINWSPCVFSNFFNSIQ